MATPLSTPIATARILCSKDSTILTDPIGVSLGNDCRLIFNQRLIENRKPVLPPTEGSLNVTSSNLDTGGTPGIFSLATDFFFLKEMELTNISPVSTKNFVPVKPLDSAALPGNTSLDFVRVNQPTTDPMFEVRGNQVEIFPTPTASWFATVPLNGAIKYFYYPVPTAFAATSDNLTFQEALSPDIFAHWIAGKYLNSADPVQRPGDAYIAFGDALFSSLLALLGPGSQQPQQWRSVPMTGRGI